MSDAKLMPCPWFGQGSLIGCEHLRALICEDPDPAFCIQCSCGAVGPGSATPAGAIKNWNTRVSDPAAQAVVEALENMVTCSNASDCQTAKYALEQARAALATWHTAHPKGEVE